MAGASGTAPVARPGGGRPGTRRLGRPSAGRIRRWALALAGIGLAPIVAAPRFGYQDWPAFWAAGHLAGSHDLLNPDALLAWEAAHGLPLGYFPYPPAAAWLFAPFAALPLELGFVAFAVLGLACLAGAGVVGARAFGLPVSTALLATFAFAPATASIVIGQNAPLGLLLALIAILGWATDRPLLAGVATGLLLYKPTWALPLLGALVLGRRWAALAIALGVGALGYALSAAAAGGALDWPAGWVAGLGPYAGADFAVNADKAASIPGLVARLTGGGPIPVAVGAAIVLASLPGLLRTRGVELPAAALLVGLVASPHAWGYDAALALPILLWVLAGGIGEPVRTRLVAVAWLLGPLWLVSRQTVVSGVAVLLAVVWLAWLVTRFRGREAAPAVGPGTAGATAA